MDRSNITLREGQVRHIGMGGGRQGGGCWTRRREGREREGRGKTGIVRVRVTVRTLGRSRNPSAHILIHSKRLALICLPPTRLHVQDCLCTAVTSSLDACTPQRKRLSFLYFFLSCIRSSLHFVIHEFNRQS